MKNIFTTSLLFLTLLGCDYSSSQNNHDPINTWALRNAHKIETLELAGHQNDLNTLKQVVGDAEVVCLGESRHDIHEQFKLKHRLIKYLVEEMGFRTFVLEASLPYSYKINNYVLHGDGNLNEVMAEMPGWFLWDTQEMTSILAWIRAFNEDPDHENKVRFYGIDIVAPNHALAQIFNYLQKVDNTFFNQNQNTNLARDIIDDNYWPASRQHYVALEPEEKQKLQINYHKLFDHIKQNETNYISQSSEKEYNWILRLAYCALEANRMFSAERRIDVGLVRDNAMAANTLWIKQQLKDKMIIWAHNVHIAKSVFTMTGEDGEIQGMGYMLSKKLKNKMVSIGASFNQGAFQGWDRTFDPAEKNTLDGTFANLKMEYFLIDLKGPTASKTVEDWLNTNQRIRGQDFEMTCIPIKSFDAMYYTDHISKVSFNPETFEKLRN